MKKMVRVRTVAAGILLAMPGPAWAIVANVPCKNPFVFRNATVNIVVMPYSAAPDVRTQADQGRKLSGLVHLEALLAIAKYGSVGAVQLVGEAEDECTPEIVLDKLTGARPGARERAVPGNALVLVWGRLYVADSEIYLQSYVRFLRVGMTETITIPAGPERMIGALSAQSFAFPPQRITQSDLETIVRQYNEALELHASPDGAVTGRTADDTGIVVDPTNRGGEPRSYSVTEIRGDWIRVEPFGGQGPQGWIRARASDDAFTLRARMPELKFVEGVSGFLAARIRARVSTADGSVSADQTMLESAQRALGDYLRSISQTAGSVSSATTVAQAVPRQLRGMTAFLGAEPSADRVASALDDFGSAAALIPYSADAVNLTAAARLYLAYTRRTVAQHPEEQASALFSALGAEPQNRNVRDNLERAYRLLLGPSASQPSDWNPLSEADRQRLDVQSAALGELARASR